MSAIRLIDHMAKMPHDEFLGALMLITKDGKHNELADLLSMKSFEELPSKYKAHPSVDELINLKKLLAENGVTNVVDDLSLMRGFDYYTDIVFEVFDTDPENNRSMFGGGRYDGLVAQFGVEPVPTVGFGMGDVTLQNFLESHKLLLDLKPETDATAILIGDIYEAAQSAIAELRQAGLNIAVDSSGRKLDAQIKSAVKSGVRYAVFIGDKELTDKMYKLRNLEKGEEKELSLERVISTLSVNRSD